MRARWLDGLRFLALALVFKLPLATLSSSSSSSSCTSLGPTSCTVSGKGSGCTKSPPDPGCICDCCPASNTCLQLFSGCTFNASQPAGYSTLSPSGPHIWRAHHEISPVTITSPHSSSQLQTEPCILPGLPSGLYFAFNSTIGAYQIQGTPSAPDPHTSYLMILVHNNDVLSSITMQGRVLPATDASPFASPSASVATSVSLSSTMSIVPSTVVPSTLDAAATTSLSMTTLPSPTPSFIPSGKSTNNVPLGAIIGGLIAALLAFFTVGSLFFVFRPKHSMASTTSRPELSPFGKLSDGLDLDCNAVPEYALPPSFPNTEIRDNEKLCTNRHVSVLPGDTMPGTSVQGHAPREYHTLPLQYLQRQNRYSGQFVMSPTAGSAAGGVEGSSYRVTSSQFSQNITLASPPPPYKAPTMDRLDSTESVLGDGASGSTVVAIPGERVMICVLAYLPRRDDELELKIGDVVSIVETYMDGWGYGINRRSGERGFLPLNAMLDAKS
ncbi:hypothetical protein SeLEV6574_g04711 [Synchytrium endobioticum]|uniref:SH3 domain-containing protein n=1 Tax=Synchytrium endobioticum TaxID=286115 RepID=A0A507CY58_9FUNG|nr:hypothetical protein SeLEV6574_g04711 [Synchytrium endobioticum]